MRRLKCEKRRDSGLCIKRDTPLKTAVRRGNKGQRFLPIQHYEALPEESESNIKPGHCQSSKLQGCRSAFIGNPEDNAALPAVPISRNSSPHVSPAASTKPSVTSGSTASLSLESDLSFSSDNDEVDDTCSCTSAASDSLPSPEIFRKETSEEVLFSPFKEEFLAVCLHNKNSTLLDASHAVSILMHPAPNLSTISDNSALRADANLKAKQHGGSEADVKMGSSISSATKVLQPKTPLKLPKRKPILFRKKVWFKSPLIQSKDAPASKLPVHCDNEPFQTSSPVQHIKPEDNTSNGGQMDPEEAPRSKVRLKRSITKTPERAKFFHFSSDSDEEAFFQRMRERCDKLWSIPFFPLTAETL
ncbi:uncharacterized protein isoform X1 [Takifugu rubripes]|uniref:uncharacterized protein isoform X1 n=2 Tax=Takifugu rubripes TaxID=31033 RepID=UPI0011456A8D|nr:uncharacterized protein LOC101075393 isoform X1 [Takifugu rubripes]